MELEENTIQYEGLTAAVLNVRHLIQRCQELTNELASLKQTQDDQKRTIQNLQGEIETLKVLSSIGERQIQNQKDTILSCVRAIVLHSGENERLQSMKQLLDSENLQPEEIGRIYTRIVDEFHALYPTRPASCISDGQNQFQIQKDWSVFRLRISEPNEEIRK